MSDSGSDSSAGSYLALNMDCEFFSEDEIVNSEEVYTELQIYPYMFEPVTDESDTEDNQATPGFARMDHRRRENTDWCECGQCAVLSTVEECSCCRENTVIEAKMEEIESEGLSPIQCITQHPGFADVCCNRWVLQTAYFHYRQQYGDADLAGEALNRRYRYTAYRQFVRWCWGYLGRQVRVPLPACAVTAIRNAFPSEEISGFKYPTLQ